MMSISINQIKYALAVHETGSFSAAANMCYVTQSTLSTMIKKMEGVLELELFDRKKKPIKLTAEGQKLISQFKVVHNESKNLEELVLEIKNEFHGTLNIGIIPTLAPFLLPLFINQLIRAYPQINFTVFEITTEEIIKRIKLREIDLGLLSLPIDDDDLKNLPLFQEEFVVYDTSAANSKLSHYTVNDIEKDRLWLLEEGHCLRNQVDAICELSKDQNINTNLSYNCFSILSLIHMVKQNNGVTLLPKLALSSLLSLEKEHIYEFKNLVPSREIGIVVHHNFIKQSLLKRIMDIVKESTRDILSIQKPTTVIKPY